MAQYRGKIQSTIKQRWRYLLAFIILGIVWRLYAERLLGFSPEDNGDLGALIFAYLPFVSALPNGTKWAGFSYLLLMLALIMGVFTRTPQVDFRQLTQARVERVSQALGASHEYQGHCPQDLQQLTLRYIFSLAEPVIISGQAGCYDGGADYYRLGYVYREHWSDPRLSGRLYKATGDLPDLQPICWGEIVQIQEQYSKYP